MELNLQYVIVTFKYLQLIACILSTTGRYLS
jgi:hypothetical protein